MFRNLLKRFVGRHYKKFYKECLPIVEKTSAGCIKNKRGANAVYNVGDCFFDGLDNMTPGKCYSLNPERGTQYGWINNNAQDSWWWVEAPCEKENNRSARLFLRAARYVQIRCGKVGRLLARTPWNVAVQK